MKHHYKLFITIIWGILLIVLATACSQKHQLNNKYHLVWADNFNGTQLDTTIWTFEHGNGHHGWGNQELEYYTGRPQNVTEKNGDLIITARKENYKGFHYTSARIKTQFKKDFKYGKIEARMKLPVGQGMWPAFWLMPTNSAYGGWPKSGEIDIMEMIGKQPSTDYGTAHFGAHQHHDKGGKIKLKKGILHDAFHTFSVEWQPKSIKWFMDGKKYYQVTPDSLKPDPWPFNKKFYIIFNLAVGGAWPGNPDSTTTFPQKMIVDYVKVFQK
ncbi:MAG TPA: glycoside hydrolase family 16 protein [Balneolales bacterium]|nr:glycoside hydrolase family 16 protein [Balneolales bacterium]